MDRKTRTLIRENNKLQKEIKNRETSKILTDIIVYLRTSNISEYNQEKIRRDITEMLIDGERRGEDAVAVIGEDYKLFCDSIIEEMPKLGTLGIALDYLNNILIISTVLIYIKIAFSLLDAIIGEGGFPYISIREGDVIAFLVITVGVLCLINIIRRCAFKMSDVFKGKNLLFVAFFIIIYAGSVVSLILLVKTLFSIHVGILFGVGLLCMAMGKLVAHKIDKMYSYKF